MSEDFRVNFYEWIINSGRRCVTTPELVHSLCVFLNDNGYSIRRTNLATETIHPQMKAIRLVWYDETVEPGFVNPEVQVHRQCYQMGTAMIDLVYFNAISRSSPQYKASPFYKIEQEGEVLSTITPCQEEYEFPVFNDLAEIGCTGYFGLQLQPHGDFRQTISLATDVVTGFDQDKVEGLRWCMPLFTLLLDTLLEDEVKRTLANAYLGAEPGRLVLNGMIAPGEVKSMEAAIWFSDLRDFTALSGEISSDQLVAEMNEYFSAVVGAIYERSGEVLKFIGDAILAVFPVEQFDGAEQASEAALQAAIYAGERLEKLNQERIERGDLPLQQGVGLHIGTVKFGNIGTLQRLDFTVMGTEVNLASRIEGLCSELGKEILCSEKVSLLVSTPVRQMGEHKFKGITKPVGVFTPDL